MLNLKTVFHFLTVAAATLTGFGHIPFLPDKYAAILTAVIAFITGLLHLLTRLNPGLVEPT